MLKEILYKLFKLEELPCRSCETLRTQLEISNYEKKDLLAKILELNGPKPEPVPILKEYEPIKPRNIPWSVRRQQIEQEDRARAATLERKKQEMEEISKLEEELEIGDENAS